MSSGAERAPLNSKYLRPTPSSSRVVIPGFGEVMRARSLAITPNAMISRCLGAIVDSSLVLALPGKPQGAVECLSFVVGAIPHSVKLALKLPTSC